MQALRKGSTGEEVSKWQQFLRGQDLYEDVADERFGPITEAATKAFQKINGLDDDGVVGQLTYIKAMQLGFVVVQNPTTGRFYPAKPSHIMPIIGNQMQVQKFGEIKYKAAPVEGNPEAITITNSWAEDNIVQTHVPQLSLIQGIMVRGRRYGAGPKNGMVYCHQAFVGPLQKTFIAWKKKGLMVYILTWDGLWVPRFIRGSDCVLSNHAFGTAFDINAWWNRLRSVPALVGQRGCVRDLVAIANDNGIWWLGHSPVSDGMHFGLAEAV